MARSDRTAIKRANFVRLAEKRTNAVLEKIRILGNCSNTNAYDYSDQDVNVIFSAIEEELKDARAKFATSKRREFKLGPEKAQTEPKREVIEREVIDTRSAR